MVKEFLEKYKNELNDKSQNIKRLCDELYLKIEEERRFLELLQGNTNQALESLSPLHIHSSEKVQYH